MVADAVTQVATHTNAHQQSIDTTRNRGAPGWSVAGGCIAPRLLATVPSPLTAPRGTVALAAPASERRD